jgi:hypothetical protein
MADIFWAHWFKGNTDVANINYFWVQGIANLDTQSIIASALRGVNEEQLKHWPGTTFSMDTEEGKALLGKSAMVCYGYRCVVFSMCHG